LDLCPLPRFGERTGILETEIDCVDMIILKLAGMTGSANLKQDSLQ
jgi:hypothetical protein